MKIYTYEKKLSKSFMLKNFGHLNSNLKCILVFGKEKAQSNKLFCCNLIKLYHAQTKRIKWRVRNNKLCKKKLKCLKEMKVEKMIRTWLSQMSKSTTSRSSRKILLWKISQNSKEKTSHGVWKEARTQVLRILRNFS